MTKRVGSTQAKITLGYRLPSTGLFTLALSFPGQSGLHDEAQIVVARLPIKGLTQFRAVGHDSNKISWRRSAIFTGKLCPVSASKARMTSVTE